MDFAGVTLFLSGVDLLDAGLDLIVFEDFAERGDDLLADRVDLGVTAIFEKQALLDTKVAMVAPWSASIANIGRADLGCRDSERCITSSQSLTKLR